ncbi:hypothetical protein CEV33_2665 [Brucella grignonensis]|uniref:Uncharacterized protein n=1 Tax=Brucella grignonensis TaxID=94627 RepID=A0A256F2D6_9HYPH|nr:hypothetical protein CEV33_2665 [Brucella grignonensis]
MRPPDLSALQYCAGQQIQTFFEQPDRSSNLAHRTRQFNPRLAHNVQAARLGI